MMTKQTMEEKIKEIIDAKAIDYAKHDGNRIYFQAGSLKRDKILYVIEGTINEDNKIHWECDCPAYQWNREDPRTCKHIGSAEEVMKNDDSIRREYKIIEGDDSG